MGRLQHRRCHDTPTFSWELHNPATYHQLRSGAETSHESSDQALCSDGVRGPTMVGQLDPDKEDGRNWISFTLPVNAASEVSDAVPVQVIYEHMKTSGSPLP